MPSILLIEDYEPFRQALASALTGRGYTVAQAEDGERGVKLFRAEPTDLVITEIVMPNKDGIAVVAELRGEFPRLGIIAMTGGSAAHNPTLYLKIAGAFGANRTFEKPFAFPTLVQAIEEVLANGGRDKPQGA